MDVFDRLLELSRQGIFCARIMLEPALETGDKAKFESWLEDAHE